MHRTRISWMSRWRHGAPGLLAVLLAAVCIGMVPAPASGGSPQRIISLSPATTEILFALGEGDHIVGVTNFCDHPAEARSKAKIGGMSNPSLEAIVTLRPDLVVLTTDGNPQEIEPRLHSLGIRTYVWTERTIAELAPGIRRLGAALGTAAAGERLAGTIEKALAAIGSGARGHAGSQGIKALYIVWPEPLLVAGPGSAIADAMDLLGLQNIAARANTSYPRYSVEEVIRAAPEVLFIGKGSGMDMRSVSDGFLKKLSSVPAVQNGKICYVGDGLYRLAPRVVEGIEELSACVR